jgi:hypothetical protein
MLLDDGFAVMATATQGIEPAKEALEALFDAAADEDERN